MQWQPGRAPVTLYAEARQLGGGRVAPVVGMVGGVSQVRLPADFRLDGYGQAGAVIRDRLGGFVDGQLRAAHPLGARGRIQRRVERLDIGPSLGAALAVAKRTLRLTLDWRERIAGNARPASGPALTLGTDF